jgi:hypothetical protein
LFSPGNPYNVSEPVQSAERFVGRRDLFAWLWQSLALRQRIAVVSGPALIGKSSFLLQAQREAPDDYLVVYVDLWAAAQSGQTPLLSAAIAQTHERMLMEAAAATRGLSADAPANVWKALRDISPNRRPIFFFDHLDRVLATGEAAGWNFLDDLAALMTQHADMQVVFAVRSFDTLKRLDQLPFARAFQRELGPLTRAEAVRLMRDMNDDALEYDYEALTRIDELTGRLPYYVQLLCGQLYEQRADAGHVGVVDLEPALQALGQVAVPPFAQAWDRASPEGKLILSLLSSLKGAGEVISQTEVWTGLRGAGIKAETGDVREVLTQLVAAGALLQPGATTYRFPVDVFRHWVRVQYPIQAALNTYRWQPGRRRPPQPPVESTAAEAAPARKFPLTFLIPVAAFIIALGLLAIFWEAPRPAAPTPTATPELATMAAKLLARPPTATPIGSISTAPAGPSATPTMPPTPTPAPTITPTRPLVLARAMPAIAFMRKSTRTEWRIWLMGADGSGQIALTDGKAEDTAPAWAPDGRRLAFVSKRNPDNLDIYVMNVDGSNQVNLTNHTSDDWTPAWSPDGTEIAFSSRRSGNWELYVMWADGKDPVQLTDDPGADLAPVWSPDGRQIAFASDRKGDYDIYVMDRTGKNVRRLTDSPGNELSPAWSPDGRYIAFESSRSGQTDIYRMSAEGREQTNLTQTAGSNEHWPTWSPDSGRIAFCSNRAGDWDLFAISADGSDVVQLTDDPENEQGPAWRP